MTAALTISDLRGGYTEVDILKGVDMEVEEGQIVTVAGTNGAGKSTLAKAVVGLLPRVSGDVRLGDRSVMDVPAEQRVGLGIGYVPQVANVFAGLTILENLQIGCLAAGGRKELDEMFDRFPALAERRRAYASSLSGGERQQLAFARALVARPRIMVLDEPTAALSPAKVAESFELIRSLPKFGVTVLVIEQRARQALAISDYGYIMDGGKVALSGEAASLLADDNAAELYLGRAAVGH
mgnify:FL=1